VLMEFSVIPMCSTKSMAQEIADVIPLVETSGLDHEINAMSSVVEGDWDQLCALAKRCHMKLREKHERVITVLRFDDEAGRVGEIRGNLESLEKILGVPVHH
jgi:uncharacterized protein (TIGR00106 family)